MHTVWIKQLQFVIITHRTESMQARPKVSSVLVHNAYNAKKKKCIPVGLYRLLWGAVSCSVARLLHGVTSHRCFHSAKIRLCCVVFFTTTCWTGDQERKEKKKKHRTDRRLLWSYIQTHVWMTGVVLWPRCRGWTPRRTRAARWWPSHNFLL